MNINTYMDSEILIQLHKVELEIMDEIHRLCVNNNLTYYLVGGSALGAVRHNGFIPWDDDIDICMPRRDYERFTKLCQEQLHPDFFLQNEYTDKFYGKFIGKLIKKGTVFREEVVKTNRAQNGIFVDIFILDEIKYKKGKQKVLAKIIWVLTEVLSVKRGWTVAKNKIYMVFSCILSEYIILKLRYKFLTWDMKKDCNYYVNYGSQYGVVKQTFSKSIYGTPRLSEFENRKYYIPQRAEEFLEQLYGSDYMQLPPIEKRVCHNPVKLDFGN